MGGKRFVAERLDQESLKKLSELARLARGDILKMTTLAGLGHPGGSMSSIDFYLVLYSYANVHPESSSDLTMGRSSIPILLAEGGTPLFGPPHEFRYGQADLVRDGKDAAIITTGGMVYKAIQAYEQLKEKGVRVQVINFSCLSELDSEAILKAAQTGVIITYEDHHIQTGLGGLIANFLAGQGLGIRFRKLGATHYGSSGKPDELYRMQGLDVEGLVRAVMDEIRKTN